MAGHLQHADDYTPLARISDGYWMIAFVLAILLIFRGDLTFRYSFLFAIGVTLLLLTWSAEIYMLLGLPLQVTICAFGVAAWRGWIQ